MLHSKAVAVDHTGWCSISLIPISSSTDWVRKGYRSLSTSYQEG